MQSEQLRHQYLEALGVTSWLPRAQLPGACESAEWVAVFSYPEVFDGWDDSGVDGDTIAETTPAIDARTTAAPAEKRGAPPVDVRALTGLVDDAPKQPVRPKPEPKPGLQQQQSEEPDKPLTQVSRTPVGIAPEFKLNFYSFDDILVVDALPPHSRSDQQGMQQSLLNKILPALGLNCDKPAETFLLSWPAFFSATLNQGRQEAEKAVQRQLDICLQGSDRRYLLLMGNWSAQLVLQREEHLDQLKGIMFTPKSGVKALATHSLTEMMQLPGCKRDVWQQLQPLRKLINER